MPTKKRSWFHSPVLAVFLAILVIWAMVAAVGAFKKDREAKGLRDQYARDLSQLRSKQSELSEKIRVLSTDRGMEAEVRSRYRVVKPGEQLVVVVDNRDPSAVSPGKAPTFWDRIRDFAGF